MWRALLVLLAFCCFAAVLPAQQGSTAAQQDTSPDQASPVPATPGTRPNILLVLADDLGFSDLGCYGSEIRTPHLDQLAEKGLRFTQFYNTARCWPTRAAILTGYYAQQVRRDQLPGVSLPMGVPG
ncbi:MAG TPA: sulfatase-like hydrolase/transferase, partial [Gemmatales bacterium]|nr:sulfatase-like hydrolase/transferase [Gemmatales bacterium]